MYFPIFLLHPADQRENIQLFFNSSLDFSSSRSTSPVKVRDWGAQMVLVAQACNPNHSGGRDQEDCGLKQAGSNSSRDPILKNPITKKGLVDWLKL
jgi:hypothetical protein